MTPVELYLRSRGISLPIPDRIRFAPRLKHRDTSGRASWWPCMVGLVTDVNDRPRAIHRTFLTRVGEKAPVEPVKMSLGPIGGCSVRLAPAATWVVVGEGLETVLAAMELSNLPGWAALSAGNLQRLQLPTMVRKISICADRDANGVGERAALEAARRWRREGRTVRVVLPPAPHNDFADLLLARRAQRGAA